MTHSPPADPSPAAQGAPLVQALRLAHDWHRVQRRKGTDIPYLAHLLGVASLALEHGATEEEAIAALLHDALEDGPDNTGRTPQDLRAELVATFGERVAGLVEASTDDMPLPGEPKAPWAERKRRYLDGLAGKDTSALLVGAADKLHNARAIQRDVLGTAPGDRRDYFERFSQGQDGTLQYYRLLSDVYAREAAARPHAGLKALAEELARTVTANEQACGREQEDIRQLPALRGAGSVAGAE